MKNVESKQKKRNLSISLLGLKKNPLNLKQLKYTLFFIIPVLFSWYYVIHPYFRVNGLDQCEIFIMCRLKYP